MKRRSYIHLALVPVLCFGLLGCPSGGSGNNGARTFSKSFGNDAIDLATDAVPTPDGGYVFVGAHNARSVAREILDEDLWVTKLDDLGDVEWSKVYTENSTSAGAGDELILYTMVRARPGGGFYLVGIIDQLIELDDYKLSPLEVVVTRLNEELETVWTETFGITAFPLYNFFETDGTPSEVAYSMHPTESGGLYITGSARADVNIEGDAVSAVIPWVMRVSAAGDLMWQRTVDDDAYEFHRLIDGRTKVRETSDGGAIVAASIREPAGGFPDLPTNATRLVRYDANGSEVWTRRINDVTVGDLEVIDRQGENPSESFLLTTLEYDTLSGTDDELRVLDAGGQDVHSQGFDGYDFLHASRELTPAGGDVDAYCLVGIVDADEAPPFLRIEQLNAELGLTAEHELNYASSVLAMRTFDETNFGGFEFLVSNVIDPSSLTGNLYNIRYDLSGNEIRNTLYPYDVPGLYSMRSGLGMRVAGWVEDSTDFWTWTPLAGSDYNGGSTLTVYSLTGGARHVRSFAPELDRRIERGLQVEVIEDPKGVGDPTAFEIAVLGETAFDPFNATPAPSEPLSAWFLRLDSRGEILTQQVYETIEVSSLATPAVESGPELHRSTDTFAEGSQGGFFIGGRLGGYARVTRIDEAGAVQWVSRPLAGYDEEWIQAVIATADGGAVALGPNWAVRLSDVGDIVWRRLFDERVTGLCEGADGFLVFVHAESRPGATKLDADGELLWRYQYDGGNSVDYDDVAHVEPTTDGGAILCFAKAGVDEIVLPGGARFFGWDLQLLKVSSDGNPEWVQDYGGLLEEALGNVSILSDDGILIAGRSDSLGEASEAWILRMDFEGIINSGCAASIARTDPPDDASGTLHFDPMSYLPVILPSDDIPGDVSAFETGARAVAVTDLVVARQCSGSAKIPPSMDDDEPGDDPEDDDPGDDTGDMVTLTVEITFGEGIVYEVPDQGEPVVLNCPTVCTNTYPRGTVVELMAFADIGFTDPEWSGGDCGQVSQETCSVTMDQSRTVRVTFPLE